MKNKGILMVLCIILGILFFPLGVIFALAKDYM